MTRLAALAAATGYELDEIRGPDRDPSLVAARRRIARTLHAEGTSINQIADMMHRARSTIRNLLTGRGWE